MFFCAAPLCSGVVGQPLLRPHEPLLRSDEGMSDASHPCLCFCSPLRGVCGEPLLGGGKPLFSAPCVAGSYRKLSIISSWSLFQCEGMYKYAVRN